MNTLTRFTMGLYIILLRLMPYSFRDEFAEEMQDVLTVALAEARRAGRRDLLYLYVKEILGLMASLVRVRYRSFPREEIRMRKLLLFLDWFSS